MLCVVKNCYDIICMKLKKYHFNLCLGVLLSLAGQAAYGDDNIDSLDLESLLDTEIVSVAKKPQPVSMAAAAVHVITSEDIRRSPARHIPDLLRTVPGIHVGQIAGGVWAVTARGMNLRAANKLLVLVDGRSVYSPLFAGVHWDAQAIPLAEIERVEIVLGPGSAIWGANAVNGVINIITKPAVATEGGLAEVHMAADGERGLYVRQGGRHAEVGSWRLSAQSDHYAPMTLQNTGAKGFDSRANERLAWRSDLNPTTNDAIALLAEVYRARRGESALLSSFDPPYSLLNGTTVSTQGGHLLARWSHVVNAQRTWTLQGYWEQTKRDWPAHNHETQDTLDVDLSVRDQTINNHDISWGVNLRRVEHHLGASRTGIQTNVNDLATFSRGTMQLNHVSVYVQDDWRFPEHKLVWTLGAKLEKQEEHPLFFLPNTRLLWRPTASSTLWTAYSRSVRVPSRLDIDANSTTMLPSTYRVGGQPLPAPAFLSLDGAGQVEKLQAYEFGIKQQLSENLQVSGAAFVNRYTDLRSGAPLGVMCEPRLSCETNPSTLRYLMIPTQLVGGSLGTSRGFEVTLDWKLPHRQRVSANVSHFQMKTSAAAPDTIVQDSPGSAPAWMMNLRWSLNPTANTQLDLGLRHVSALSQLLFGQRIPAYTALDVRLSGRLNSQLSWYVNASNLGAGRHLQFVSEANDVAPTVVAPHVSVGAQLRF
jgi:iron complex outermembrane receptor protein